MKKTPTFIAVIATLFLVAIIDHNYLKGATNPSLVKNAITPDPIVVKIQMGEDDLESRTEFRIKLYFEDGTSSDYFNIRWGAEGIAGNGGWREITHDTPPLGFDAKGNVKKILKVGGLLVQHGGVSPDNSDFASIRVSHKNKKGDLYNETLYFPNFKQDGKCGRLKANDGKGNVDSGDFVQLKGVSNENKNCVVVPNYKP